MSKASDQRRRSADARRDAARQWADQRAGEQRAWLEKQRWAREEGPILAREQAKIYAERIEEQGIEKAIRSGEDRAEVGFGFEGGELFDYEFPEELLPVQGAFFGHLKAILRADGYRVRVRRTTRYGKRVSSKPRYGMLVKISWGPFFSGNKIFWAFILLVVAYVVWVTVIHPT